MPAITHSIIHKLRTWPHDARTRARLAANIIRGRPTAYRLTFILDDDGTITYPPFELEPDGLLAAYLTFKAASYVAPWSIRATDKPDPDAVGPPPAGVGDPIKITVDPPDHERLANWLRREIRAANIDTLFDDSHRRPPDRYTIRRPPDGAIGPPNTGGTLIGPPNTGGTLLGYPVVENAELNDQAPPVFGDWSSNTDHTTDDEADPFAATPIEIGQFVRHATADADWYELVLAWGPDGRMVTVDPQNGLHRYSDPTDQWILVDPPAGKPKEPRGFTALDQRGQR